MISLGVYRANLFPLFRLAKGTTVGFEVVHHGVVYDVTVAPTDKVPYLARAKRGTRKGVNRELVRLDNCSACGELEVASICLNKKCTKVPV